MGGGSSSPNSPVVKITPNPPKANEESLSKSSRKRRVDASMKKRWCVEDFMKEGLSFDGHKKETISSFLSTEKSRQCYFNYLKSQFDDPPDQIMTFFNEIRFATVDSVSVDTTAVESIEGTDSKQTSDAAHSSLVLMMAMQSFSLFLSSPYYSAWRAEEAAGLNAVTAEIDATGLVFQNQLLNSKTNEQLSFAQRAFAVLDGEEVQSLMDSSSWLTMLITAAESLPIPFSLSTASAKRRNFPLIYVNAKFEELTGYSRAEIIGHNCKFLQGASTEPESVSILCNALGDNKAVRCRITNHRKDGSTFTNHLNMKPIFDQHGQYRYVIGLQFLISHDDQANIEEERLNDRMMRALPDQIFDLTDDE